MSVTVGDLMKLPCLRQARVAAGAGGLGRIVSSVSVLEYAEPGKLLKDLYNGKEWAGGELVISGFINIKDDLEAQLLNVRWMAEAGEVGLVLYYVGVFVPRIDPRLAALCDELDFALICMPENQLSQRYSEVICETMEAIFKDRQSGAGLVGDVLDRVSHLPDHQRSVETVLKMLSDQARATAVLTDGGRRVLNAAAWPRTLDANFEGILEGLKTLPEAGGPPLDLGPVRLYRCPLTDPGMELELYLFKEGEELPLDLARQAGEVVRLAVNLWSRNHGQVVVAELVRAILMDEPIKMRRLADIFHIDVGSIHTMWVVRGDQPDRREELKRLGRELAEGLLRPQCRTVAADFYEENLIIFLSWPPALGTGTALVEELRAQFAASGLAATVTVCHDLATTTDVRRAYLVIRDHLGDAEAIWPGRGWYSLQEAEFARTCRRTVAEGELAVRERLAVLEPLAGERESGELARTLAAYLLDAERNVARTAELLFLHKNTIKYRMQRIASCLGYSADKMPETFALYSAVALKRMLEQSG